MSCGCEIYECINVFANPCDESVTLPIYAKDTGVYKMVFQFNGVNFRIDISVSNNGRITIPITHFNENYTHVLQFYKEDGQLLNNTCYKMNMMQTVFTNPNSQDIYQNYRWVFAFGDAPQTNVNPEYIVDVANGNTITHPCLADEVLSVIVGNGNSQPITTEGYLHDPETQTITFANPLSDINVYVQTKQIPA